MTTNQIICGDCLEVMKDWPDNSVDLVFCSPPYEDARTYGIEFRLKGQDWVDWAIPRFLECVRICKGVVAWVVEGKTKRFRWSATPALLMADLHRSGISLRKPPIFQRIGIPGSGGPDWLRNDYESIICASKGKLPWSENTAMGHPPKCPRVGGAMSYRTQDGVRRNKKTGIRLLRKASRNRKADGTREERTYFVPKVSNPGNVIDCGVMGGGHIGNKLAHENEAPFPERLAEFFIKSFCPPAGIVVDCFSGSGTTADQAERFGRKWIVIDIRHSQCDLTTKRLQQRKSQAGLFERR